MRRATGAVLLLLGGATIVAASLFTLSHMSDRTVFTVLVPGAVVGLILIGWSVQLSRTDVST